ncbi:antA/AntB antirepressor family protein [Zymobacter palmae]|uniref:Phage anti-repressor protein n=1 Tax=Zymobacter palmae TaxID=33074 RepID=A0A348HEF2_9GAMM|nr:antA/AntB antirepressor family protein [Zymobacter palmae]BBG30004.1 phage anti-repressor protein [Zymobacter palmae]
MATASAVQAIIPVFSGTIHDEQSQLVDARALHAFLEVGKRFATWITDRINQYGFIENADYVVFANYGENSLVSQNGEIKRAAKSRGGDRRSKTYHLTLDMAKELSMVERNEKGRQARRYFIDCEKRLRQIAPDDADTIQAKTIGTNGFNVLHDLIAKKAKVLPIGIQRQAKHRMWGMLHTRFNVPRAELIPANDMDSACNFVAAYAIEGEYIPAAMNDDHITVNLPKAPNDRFDNLPASRLFGMDLIYHSKLTELLALLRKAIKNDQYVRVMDISAAGIEVEALRHWVEELVRLAESFQTNLNCIQNSSAELLERWMTIFHPCIDMLDGIVAHEFRERLVAIKAASGSLQRWMGKTKTALEQA